MHNLPGGSADSSAAGKKSLQDRKITLKASTLTFAVMVTVFLVAVVFAANENDVIGWIVVIVSLGWLLLAAFLAFGIARGTKKMQEQFAGVRADMARSGGGSTTLVQQDTSARDMKLDHSFKIVEVQVGVVKEYLDQEGDDARGMVDRALETIEITAHNARGMMKDGKNGKNGGDPLSGDIVG
ncbi:hypothetical protein [Zhihengliuella sp.]|uniref:hypothetical protein n=1 Tax=Zhihengliuella sp. TaxID=1954483 RepID=UPI0028126E70|nr:hypothetical protein [Zhihengliuella sp.]